MTSWGLAEATNVKASSADVKFDQTTGLLNMFYVAPNERNPGTFLAPRTSRDGIQWSSEEQLSVPFAFPAFAHNVGVASNPEGVLLADKLIGYGGPGVAVID
ncbi:MAG: hypothetical protein U0931_29820 [Vulcanimicrobiota bacterium]